MIEARRRAVEEAMGWIHTPYVPNAKVKGPNGGADCLTVIAGVFEGAGVIDALPIPRYAHDFHMHNFVEWYLLGKDDTPGLLHFCDEVPGPPERRPMPADIVVWKFGNLYAHAAIVIDWPLIIHAWADRPVGRDDAERRTVLKRIHETPRLRNQLRPRKFFRVKGWDDGL